MFGLGSRHKVSEVFTPRRTEVNRDVYVDRPELERNLRRLVDGTKHVVVHGESGSGKSWLYKKVLQDCGAHVVVANAANALRMKSLASEICNSAGLAGRRVLRGSSDSGTAGVRIPVVEAGVATQRDYDIVPGDILLEAFAEIRKAAGTRPAIVVVDNLELIVSSDELMDELGALITLLDDARYAEHRVKLLLVGVPSVLREYFGKTKAAEAISNRLAELDEVSALSERQVAELVEKGFRGLLKVEISEQDLAVWQRHIVQVTTGYAQAVQEYCEQLGYIVEDANWKADISQLWAADDRWLKQGLSHASEVVSARMNVRETRVGRRNQVLFALGSINNRLFTANDVEAIVRREFPESTQDTTLAIGQILSELAAGENPLLKLSTGGYLYVFKNARYAMALRVLLRKEGSERVQRIPAIG